MNGKPLKTRKGSRSHYEGVSSSVGFDLSYNVNGGAYPLLRPPTERWDLDVNSPDRGSLSPPADVNRHGTRMSVPHLCSTVVWERVCVVFFFFFSCCRFCIVV